ncbi:MAG: DNA-directed RNA polymerase subunit beta [Desulfobacteraceae bacterium]|nr:DNA-directed RNA polymerase subunit beta [Desulfobacteraceae bacterium]MDH3572747.1 DNA-directed RNA polymerase subunit beta [Desulfobacteraceae bacterium]MDH3721322.1 DNA-directed RNA polymerase subunit beta [Desulfobacteraceae bacterium]MDH3835796.1 DNA-directed RNA polymerase subunit beta [Desulfobacteraceae bacterium]MDH3874568.1 DNA-directed RNA polymerase subunit beta [Desulfobacteraceae bacterium]
MSERLLANRRVRKNFGKIPKIVEIPNLIAVQQESFNRFLQKDVPPEKRRDIGLQAVYKSVFPIKDFTGTASLEFVSYRFGEVKHSVQECMHRGMTYEIPLRITVRLVVYDIDKETGITNIRDIKEQEIYFGTIPLMTDNGTFIINGTERVVVSQLHRSSGVFFDHDKGKTHSSGKVIYTSRLIPVRGSWIDMEIDHKDIVNIRIDRRRKLPITILFKSFGYTSEDILAYFYKTERFVIRGKRIFKEFNEDLLRKQRASRDVKDPETGDTIVSKGRVFTKAAIKRLKSAGVDLIPISVEDILNKVFSKTIVVPDKEEPIVKCNQVLDEENLQALRDAGITEFELLFIDGVTTSDSIHKTLLLDKVETKEGGLIEIYRRLRPGNPATPEVAQDFVDHMFFKSSYYDLSGVGRMKINTRLGINSSIDLKTLRTEDILLTTKTLLELKDTQGAVDDIDHLGNRRVRAVGELLENQYRIGLVRMERAIKERMSLQEVDALMPHDLANPKPVSAVVKEFFGTSQLSQFMDQTNPLSETTHKRRLSALGPGGLTRERAGFEVRDVHPSHYGRICPIETPEGPNIGLIVSLSTYARVNEYGFIETPYSVVKDATVLQDVKFLTAFEEKEHPVAQANALLDENRKYVNPLVTSRVAGEFMMVKAEDIELMDISPNQLVSVSASLIPFLENDDANRALMGSNMQRQAVPLISNKAPLVGTGIEGVVAKDSGVTVVTQHDGIVVHVDASRIVIRHKDKDDDEASEIPVTVYNLSKFIRSNQNTCFNQRPIVRKGQKVEAGQIIADGPATDHGELALGKNITVAFMPWGGYNFEDSILVGERLHRDGVYTSVHIEEFEVVARDTKLGKEDITRDIPNVGEEALKELDESGIIRLGAEVVPGDILVGKITPKGETQLSPEEKLLRAIFGEKAGDVKDTSLRVPPGVQGIVIDAKVFSRRGVGKDDRTRWIEDSEIASLEKERDDKLEVIQDVVRTKLEQLLVGQKSISSLKKGKKVLIQKGDKIDSKMLAEIPVAQIEGIVLDNPQLTEKVHDILERYRDQCEICRNTTEKLVSRFEKGDDLPPGVIKLVKVYVAMKRKLSVGDKMAGRHGNKGVVSRILPQEDLPYFEDGTPVDMILNPLGVPSRMNVGQVLEIHLGWAAKGLGDQLNRLLEEQKVGALRDKIKKIFEDPSVQEMVDGFDDKEVCEFVEDYKDGVHMATPVFDGAKEAEIKSLLVEAGLSSTGQTTLYDGRTGEPFKEKITVGTMYVLKLHHLVDDKIHARSIGPYSLVTQQPLGGKAQFGGQRLGEMEVWAMEAYGAAHALQEFLTVKSDDMAGRTRMYEKIVKGQNTLDPGLPESFKVLTKELKSLGLDITLLEGKQ